MTCRSMKQCELMFTTVRSFCQQLWHKADEQKVQASSNMSLSLVWLLQHGAGDSHPSSVCTHTNTVRKTHISRCPGLLMYWSVMVGYSVEIQHVIWYLCRRLKHGFYSMFADKIFSNWSKRSSTWLSTILVQVYMNFSTKVQNSSIVSKSFSSVIALSYQRKTFS